MHTPVAPHAKPVIPAASLSVTVSEAVVMLTSPDIGFMVICKHLASLLNVFKSIGFCPSLPFLVVGLLKFKAIGLVRFASI